MNKKTFNLKIDKIAERLEYHHFFVCIFLENEFETALISKMYQEIINAKNSRSNGIFGKLYIKYNRKNYKAWQQRKTSLELFRHIVIDEKLYLKL